LVNVGWREGETLGNEGSTSMESGAFSWFGTEGVFEQDIYWIRLEF
jgi:hypothetical protein